MQIPKLFSPVTIFRIGVISLIFFALGCGQNVVEEKKEPIRPVKYIEINPSGLKANLEYSGRIKAVQEVFMAFEVSGKIDSFPVKEGLRVKKGAVLAQIDDRDFQTTLDSRTADLNAAKADYERARELYENNTISKRDLDVARRNYEVSTAGVRAAQKTLGDTKLVAPFSGLVAKTLVENFQNIQAKQAVLILQDDSSLEMTVDIPERDYVKIDKDISLSELTRLAKPEILVTSFPGQQFKAEFKEAAATADSVTRTFELTLGFQAPENISIMPGMTARLIITGSTQKSDSTVLIPSKAVLSDDNNHATVWLIDASSNTVKRQIVDIGQMSGDNILITNGLKAGDIIAGSGVHQLRDGMIVRKYVKP